MRTDATVALCFCALLAGCGEPTPTSERAPEPAGTKSRAETVFIGGPIITMEPALATAEALAVSGGRILAVGNEPDVRALIDSATEVVNLGGRALLPGFFDAHSHFGNALQIVNWANVSAPPVGPVDSVEALVETLSAFAEERRPRPGEWIIAYGLDPNELDDRREVTVDDLDPAFPDNPLLIIHVSNHGAVLNSAALNAVGIDENTQAPPGGIIERLPDSRKPSGLLMETAFFPVFSEMPQPTEEALLAAFEPAQQAYAANGYTTVMEGATSLQTYTLLARAAAEDRLFLDLITLPIFYELESFPGDALEARDYRGRLRVGGSKILADGSPQARTAFFSEPYLPADHGDPEGWRGEPTVPYDVYEDEVRKIVNRGLKVVSHGNGDASIDYFIRALTGLGVSAKDGRRDIVIHSQFVRPDQLDAYVTLGATASFFTNHAFFWGDTHRRNLGEARAAFLSPLAAAKARGLRFSNHTDYSVTPLDPLFTLWTATERRTRSGSVLGEDQRVDVDTALRALTIDAAWQFGEEASKGSLAPGKLADLVVLDQDPRRLTGDALTSLKILATLKEGQVVFGSL